MSASSLSAMNARGGRWCQGTENTYVDDELGKNPVYGLERHLIAAGALRWFPDIVLVVVKEAGNLLLQLRRVTRLAHGSCVVEKLPLDASGQVVPLHDHGRPEALQDMLLILCKRCPLVAIVSRCWPRRTSLAFPAGNGSSLLGAGIA